MDLVGLGLTCEVASPTAPGQHWDAPLDTTHQRWATQRWALGQHWAALRLLLGGDEARGWKVESSVRHPCPINSPNPTARAGIVRWRWHVTLPLTGGASASFTFPFRS